MRYDFSREHILESVDAILGRLGTDRLDILLLHRPDPLWEGEEIADAFGKLRGAGKVRYFGVSNRSGFPMEYLQSFLPDRLVVNQVKMSLLHHGFAEVSVSFNQKLTAFAGLRQGAFGFLKPRGMVFTFCRRQGSANALGESVWASSVNCQDDALVERKPKELSLYLPERS
jgi:predicted oxidoreductase